MALVGFCGSRDLPSRWRKLVASVVYAVARAGRGIAVGCNEGAEAMALRECFTPTWALRAPTVRVFAASGPNDQDDGEGSDPPLVQEVSRLPMAMAGGNGGMRVVINWWAGGDASVDQATRLQATSDAMVSAVAAPGERCGLVAFVTAGPGRSPEDWRTIHQAHQRGVPVVVFGCGCSVRDFPSLGNGHWTTAGGGVWGRGWRWEEETILLGYAIRETIFDLLNWTPARSSREKVKQDFPLTLNPRRWLMQRGWEEG